jgi:hypothetical protein
MTSGTNQTQVLQTPYLRVQRNFPMDNPQALSVEVDRAYCDTAAKVNSRTIGIFPVNKPAVNGELWFINSPNEIGTKQQGLRQVYQFTSTGNIAHGINLTLISGFTKIYGTFTDGTNWYPLPYVDVASAANQVAVKVTPTNIVISAGAGSPPTISSGYVILEWLSQT